MTWLHFETASSERWRVTGTLVWSVSGGFAEVKAKQAADGKSTLDILSSSDVWRVLKANFLSMLNISASPVTPT